MKITVFNGSPRAEMGNTHIMTEEFSKGAQEAGAEVDFVFLVKKEIKHCNGCFTCWIKTPGKCAIKDDMEELLKKITSSDIMVLASPVYVDNVTGIMKNFMDRTIPLVLPFFEKDEKGEYLHPKRFEKNPKIAVISNSGLPEQSHFQVLRLLFRRVARNMNSEVIAEIYRGAGELLRKPPLILQPVINKYKQLLRRAGREAVESMKLSEGTMAELEEPLIPAEMYIKGANLHWKKMLAGLETKQA